MLQIIILLGVIALSCLHLETILILALGVMLSPFILGSLCKYCIQHNYVEPIGLLNLLELLLKSIFGIDTANRTRPIPSEPPRSKPNYDE